jgi:hypothetical protein
MMRESMENDVSKVTSTALRMGMQSSIVKVLFLISARDNLD